MKRRFAASFVTATLVAAAVCPTPAAAVYAAPAAATAADRTAVFIASGAGTDPALGDNLTEVAIAKLAEQSSGERVGTHELRRWIEKSGNAESVPACISRTPCLRRLGAELGIRKIISGSVLADRGAFTIALTLLDSESGGAEATSTKTVGGEVEQVIRAVQDEVVELVRPRSVAPRLDLAGDPAAAAAEDATPVLLVTPPANDGQATRRGWPLYVGLGTAAATVLSLSAAGLLGIMATEDPSGVNRAEAQRDLARRDDYATAANALWIVGGALGLATIAMFAWPQSQSDGP